MKDSKGNREKMLTVFLKIMKNIHLNGVEINEFCIVAKKSCNDIDCSTCPFRNLNNLKIFIKAFENLIKKEKE